MLSMPDCWFIFISAQKKTQRKIKLYRFNDWKSLRNKCKVYQLYYVLFSCKFLMLFLSFAILRYSLACRVTFLSVTHYNAKCTVFFCGYFGVGFLRCFHYHYRFCCLRFLSLLSRLLHILSTNMCVCIYVLDGIEEVRLTIFILLTFLKSDFIPIFRLASILFLFLMRTEIHCSFFPFLFFSLSIWFFAFIENFLLYFELKWANYVGMQNHRRIGILNGK